MNTRATDFPAAVLAAVFKSVSLREEDTVVESEAALLCIASKGYHKIEYL